MKPLTDKDRKFLRWLLFLNVIVAVALGLKGVFLDLYDPGNSEARYYNTIVNWLFIASILLSLPLVYEKYLKFSEWQCKFDVITASEQNKMIWGAVKPICIKICTVLLLTLVASIIISLIWQIPPDVIENYKNYYYGASDIPKDFNNISFINLSNRT